MKNAMVHFLGSGGRMYGDAVGDFRAALERVWSKDPADPADVDKKIEELKEEIKTLENTKIKELKKEIEELEEKIKELEKKQGEERRLGL